MENLRNQTFSRTTTRNLSEDIEEIVKMYSNFKKHICMRAMFVQILNLWLALSFCIFEGFFNGKIAKDLEKFLCYLAHEPVQFCVKSMHKSFKMNKKCYTELNLLVVQYGSFLKRYLVQRVYL